MEKDQVTPPLPDRIAAAIDAYAQKSVACGSRYETGPIAARTTACALIAEVVAERDAATKRADGLAAELSEAKADVRDLTDVLRRNGFRQCDSIICNCNGWHHVDGFAARFREIDDAIGDHNGKTLLAAVQEKLAQLAAANAQRDELLRLLKVERAEGGHADESPVVCRVFWGHECDCGWAKRRNTIDAAIARAQSGQPAQRDDDGTASGGGS
jgi:hypothetical protein